MPLLQFFIQVIAAHLAPSTSISIGCVGGYHENHLVKAKSVSVTSIFP
jgi:hypothetical protein